MTVVVNDAGMLDESKWEQMMDVNLVRLSFYFFQNKTNKRGKCKKNRNKRLLVFRRKDLCEVKPNAECSKNRSKYYVF